MLGDPDRTRAGTDDLRGLLRRQPDDDAQHEDLALLLGQLVEQVTQLRRQLPAQRPLLGARADLDRVRDVRDGVGCGRG